MNCFLLALFIISIRKILVYNLATSFQAKGFVPILRASKPDDMRTTSRSSEGRFGNGDSWEFFGLHFSSQFFFCLFHSNIFKEKSLHAASLTLKSSHYPRKIEISTHTNDIRHSSASVFVYCLLVKSLLKYQLFIRLIKINISQKCLINYTN